MNRTTGQNIMSKIDLKETQKDLVQNRWVVRYEITREYIEPSALIDIDSKTFIIQDQSEFESGISSYDSLIASSIEECVNHAEAEGNFTQYIDNSGDLWVNEGISTDSEITAWEPDVEVAAGFLRSYNDINYYCIQKHTTQASWTPDVVPALWGIIPETSTGPQVWVQGNYSIGDQVYFPTIEDEIYESNIDNNVWSPEGYSAGWDLV